MLYYSNFDSYPDMDISKRVLTLTLTLAPVLTLTLTLAPVLTLTLTLILNRATARRSARARA